VKKIVFSAHRNFIPIIKDHFSNPEEYQVIGLQPGFVKALTDVDVQNVSMLEVDHTVRDVAINKCVDIVRNVDHPTTDNQDFNTFVENNLDPYLFTRLFDAVVLLIAIDAINPDIIVLHNDVEPHMKGLALWAKKHNVPCLHVPHSIIIDSEERSVSTRSDVHDIITASDIAVAGQYQQDWYLDRGLDKTHMHKTGLPQFDNLYVDMVSFNGDKARHRKMLTLRENEPVVMFASSWRQDTNLLGCHDDIQSSYIQFLNVAKMVGFQPLIKIHPHSNKSNFDFHTMMANQLGVEIAITQQHLYTCIRAADIVVTFGPSNLLLEASFYPVHLVATHGYYEDDAIVKLNEDKDFTNHQNVATAISKLLSSPIRSMQEFQHKYVGVVDGNSGNRIAETIKNIMR